MKYVRDFIAELLSEVCADVCNEPPLQPLSGETLTYATANVEDGACLDISAAGFGAVSTKRLFLMLRSLIQCLQLSGVTGFIFILQDKR